MFEKMFWIYETYLLDQHLFFWRHFSKTQVVQNTDCSKNLVWNRQNVPVRQNIFFKLEISKFYEQGVSKKKVNQQISLH